jgi:hypothetical protein
MLVLRRRDEDRVDRLVIKQLSKVLVRLNLRCDRLGFLQATGVNVSNSDRLHVAASKCSAEDLPAPAACANEADADPFVGSEDPTWRAEPARRHPGGTPNHSL